MGVTVRDAPIADRAVRLRLRWRRLVWSCPDGECATRTQTEDGPAEPRRVLTTRAEAWATARVAAIEDTPASIARAFGVSWSTVRSAVEPVGRARVDGAGVNPVAEVGFDETVTQPARRRRRRRFVTAVVDVDSGAVLDVFEGREAADLRAWMAPVPPAWASGSPDPHGAAAAPWRNRTRSPLPSPLAEVTVVVDPFHVVRLADEAPGRRRRRVRDLDDEVRDGWVAKEKVRDVHLVDDVDLAAERLDDAVAWCTAAGSGPGLVRLAKTLRRWKKGPAPGRRGGGGGRCTGSWCS